MRTFLAATMTFVLTSAVFAQTPAPAREAAPPYPETISVNGTGRATVTPDRFTFTVGVQTIADTVDSAVNENNAKVSAVIAALKKAGATDKDVRTSNFSIYPQQDYGQGKLPRILGYQVVNNITVRRENVAEVGRLLQVAVNAGVNTSSGLQFELSDPTRGRDQALRAAFDDAKSKASLLAQAAGRTLGRALTISEGAASAPPPRVFTAQAMRAEAAVTEVPVEAGTQQTAYTVSVVFELR